MSLALFVTALALLAIGTVHADDETCPAIYKRYCENHSSCLPESSCDIQARDLTQEQKDYVLKLHNKYRNEVATGGAKDKDGQELSKASNMMQLEWDEELAKNAQLYANQCIYEHDLLNCRQVPNFVVGQNLAFQNVIGGLDLPDSYREMDWDFAVGDWYRELRFYSRDAVSDMQPPESEEKEIRHLTQLMWAETFRVGCGFVLYKTATNEDKLNLTRLYVCEYGPTGNIYDSKVYEQGETCSHCPINSCCGDSCGDGSEFPGLCRRTDSQPPKYPLQEPSLFYCAFEGEPDCASAVSEGEDKWTTVEALGGNYISIVLEAGETSTLSFSKTVKISDPAAFCVYAHYRAGPNRDGDELANQAHIVLNIPSMSYTYPAPLKEYNNPARQQFSHYSLTASWNQETELKLKFEVPAGKPAQFFEVQSILVEDGKCKKK